MDHYRKHKGGTRKIEDRMWGMARQDAVQQRSSNFGRHGETVLKISFWQGVQVPEIEKVLEEYTSRTTKWTRRRIRKK